MKGKRHGSAPPYVCMSMEAVLPECIAALAPSSTKDNNVLDGRLLSVCLEVELHPQPGCVCSASSHSFPILIRTHSYFGTAFFVSSFFLYSILPPLQYLAAKSFESRQRLEAAWTGLLPRRLTSRMCARQSTCAALVPSYEIRLVTR